MISIGCTTNSGQWVDRRIIGSSRPASLLLLLQPARYPLMSSFVRPFEECHVP